MTDSIQGPMSGMHRAVMRPPMTQSLTNEQAGHVQCTLSKYDASSLTESNITAIKQSFKDAGIWPTQALRKSIESAGFDPAQLRGQSNPNPMGARPPKAEKGGSINTEVLQAFQDILEGYDLSNLSFEEEKNLTNELTSSGLMRTGVMLDLTA